MVIGRVTLKFQATMLLSLVAMCTAALQVPAAAQVTQAGIVIDNTAEATYDDSGVTRTVTSNTVQVRVDELLDVAAASLEAGPLAVRASPAVLSFLVSNTGNGPEAFTLEADTAVAGNAFDATLDSVAIDSNGNGVYDPGVDEVLPAPSVTVSRAAGVSQTVFVILTIPAGIADGAQSAVHLIARTATGTGAPGTLFAGAGENGTDAVVGLSGGVAVTTGQLVGRVSKVTLVKSAMVNDPFGGTTVVPGATITYGLEASVGGSATVNGLVITDAIPASTIYVANSLTLDGQPLSDAPDDDVGEASSAGITVNLGNVPGGSSSIVTFAVLVKE